MLVTEMGYVEWNLPEEVITGGFLAVGLSSQKQQQPDNIAHCSVWCRS